jgi:stage III sporulation protein AD
MDIVIKIIGVAFIGAVISILLRKNSPEFSILVTVATSLVIIYLIYDSFLYVIDSFNYIVAKTSVDSEILAVVMKICGIGIVSEYFCNIIEDAGEVAIAKKAQMATKVVIFVMTIPLIIRVVESVWNLF